MKLCMLLCVVRVVCVCASSCAVRFVWFVRSRGVRCGGVRCGGGFGTGPKKQIHITWKVLMFQGPCALDCPE